VYNVSEFSKIVEHGIIQAKMALRETKYDTIAFTGTSGAAMAYILSNEMGIPLLCVRKNGEPSHFASGAHGLLEGNIATKKYMIVDDFICGGNTMKRIQEEISLRVKGAVCVSILLYDFGRSTRKEWGGIPIYTARDQCDTNYDQQKLFPYGTFGNV
jgi:orotate phosphoribosyltransferase-like protein